MENSSQRFKSGERKKLGRPWACLSDRPDRTVRVRQNGKNFPIDRIVRIFLIEIFHFGSSSAFPAAGEIREKTLSPLAMPHGWGGCRAIRSDGRMDPALLSLKHGCRIMSQFLFMASAVSALGLPLIAMVALLLAKLSSGPAARRAERRFLAVLVVLTLVTAHTVTTQNAAWLIHTTTLGLMIVGSLWIPGQSTGETPLDGDDANHPFFAG